MTTETPTAVVLSMATAIAMLDIRLILCGKYIKLLVRHRMVRGYVNSMRKRRPKGGVAEPKVILKLPFIRIGRYGHFRSEWASLTD